jgi:hypothetical protein
MTTVAFDGKLLAVDKASWTESGRTWNAVTKLYELRAEERQKLDVGSEGQAWIAFMSDPGLVIKLRDWLIGLSEEKPEAPDKGATIGVIARSDGSLYRLTGWYSMEKIESVPFAGGGGQDIALGAMLAGASAAMALALIARRSAWVAAGIDFVNIENGEFGGMEFDVRMTERKS